jgi:hypothetical protein
MSAAFDGQLVFVLGAPRSGTTWLAELLQAHPSAVGIPQGETQVFWALAPLWRAAERPHGGGISGLISHDRLVAAVRTFCDALFAGGRAKHGPGASHFVEKTPAHAVHVKRMHEVYPDAWFIHIVRDGRDVVRSIVRFELEELIPVGLPKAAAEWDRMNRLILREAPHLSRYRQVRYEDLVASPVDGSAALLEWVGLPCDDDVRARLAEAAGTPVSQHAGASRDGPGKWREDLTEAQLSAIYHAAGPLLVELGYLGADELARWRRRAVYRRTEALRVLRELSDRATAPVRRTIAPLRHHQPWAIRRDRRIY